MKKLLRHFENTKSDLRSEAIRLWRTGLTVIEIARQVHKSRDTIYRWVKMTGEILGKNRKRIRVNIDSHTSHRILEVYILLKAPSMRKLSETLDHLFHIQMTVAQLRYHLKKTEIYYYRPSGLFDSIMTEQSQKRFSLNKARGAAPVEGSVRK